jgi:hypothetical protein
MNTNRTEREGKARELAALERSAHSARVLQYNASRMRYAAGYGRLERQLEGLYRSIDRLRGELQENS